MAFDAPEALCERLGVAVLTAGTKLSAASNRVPSRIGPFDARLRTHNISVMSRLSHCFAYCSPNDVVSADSCVARASTSITLRAVLETLTD